MLDTMLDQIEQHFATEESLLEHFETLNAQIKEAFQGIGLKEMTPEQVAVIGETTHSVQQGLDEIHRNRELLLTQFNDSTDSAYSEIAQLLSRSTSPRAMELKQRWGYLLGRAMRARATFESNQMTLLYSVDYYHRFIAGLVEVSSQSNRYGQQPEDQSKLSGNLVRKNC